MVEALENILNIVEGGVLTMLPIVGSAAAVGIGAFLLFLGVRWVIKAVRAVK